MNKNILALVLGLSVVGCASNSGVESTIPASQMDKESVCCVSKKDFAWVALDKTEDIGFSIDDTSPVWDFQSGKSFFNAFEFSPRSGKVKVTLSSKMLKKQVFAPTVQLLDKNYQVSRTIDLDAFNVRYSDMFDANRYVHEFEVDAQELPYMVVYTDPSLIGETITVPHPARVRAEESGEPRPIVTDPKFTYSYTGELHLEVQTLSLGARQVAEPASVQATAATVATGAVAAEAATVEKKAAPAEIQPETKQFYHTAIEKAVADGNIPKALSLLDEAKALNVEGAQEVFVKAINAK
ncbi:maltose operon periplasmic protein MalM [Vibrio variabilis]|uniref:Maltose operon periplasmic protein MalM n=1 Tax=Vibrio variabilis TaxID=990271 RepID=A0ABQ0JD72_9VIBR|nr:maltose operon periplasmic protein MalM [Vibrio variabilis]